MTNNHSELKRINYEIFILGLSALSIFNLVLFFVGTSSQTDIVLGMVNYFISFIFLLDFLFRLLTTPNKSQYFFKQGGWADLLSSFPYPITYALRLVRMIRSYKQLKKQSGQRLFKQFINDRASSALLVVIFLILLIMQFGSIFVLHAEATDPQSNIVSGSDALWWTFVTITTVGYGDQFPVTDLGRLIGMLVMMVGVGLFGVITGFLANAFLSPPKDAPDPHQDLLKEVLQEIKDIKKDIKS